MPRRVVPICSLPELRLARVVEEHVVRHDQVRVGADPQAREVDALGAQLVELAGQHLRVDHDAVADRAQLARIEDPGRDQVELPLHAVAHDGVAGVVAALEADHEVRLLGEQVDDLALALVAPLGAHDHDAGHVVGQSRARRRRPGTASGRPPSVESSNGSAAGRLRLGLGRCIGGSIRWSCAEHRQRIAADLVEPRDGAVADLRAQLGRMRRRPPRRPLLARRGSSSAAAPAVLVARVDDRVELLEHPRRRLLGADVVDVQQVDRAQPVDQLAERVAARRRRRSRAASPAAAAASRSRPCGRPPSRPWRSASRASSCRCRRRR